MIKCPNCSAELKFDVGVQQVTCEYCGSKFNPNELQTTVKSAGEQDEIDPDKLIEGKSYTCSQCGAKLMTFDETAITFCSYCGSQAMIESKMMKTNMPDYIIPFKKNQDECVKFYKKKLAKALFAPSYMKSDIVVSKFRGIYMPYVVYYLSKNGTISNTGSKFKKHRGNYDYYDDYRIDSDIDAEYNGISYDLVSKFYDQFSHAIPHDYAEAVEFNPNYLTGFYADTKDVANNIYDGEAIRIARDDSVHYLKKRKEFRKYGCSNPKALLDITQRKIGMFPIYFLAVRDKKNEYVNYAVVNGQTGKVAMDLPVDFKKYIIGSLLLTIPIFIAFELFLFVLPYYVAILAIILSLISLIISNSQLNKAYAREHHTDDKGYMKAIKDKIEVVEEETKNGRKGRLEKNKAEKMPLAEKIKKYMYKQILAILVGLSVVIVKPVHDYYYYGAVIVSLLLTIIAFYDLVKEHNLLVSSKLPQLEIRGGDEHE